MSKKQIKNIDVDQDAIKPVKKHKHIALKVLLVIIIVIITRCAS